MSDDCYLCRSTKWGPTQVDPQSILKPPGKEELVRSAQASIKGPQVCGDITDLFMFSVNGKNKRDMNFVPVTDTGTYHLGYVGQIRGIR